MTRSKVTEGLVLALGLIAISLGLAWAGRAGVVAADVPTRITMVISCLLISFYGNAIPKVLLRSGNAIAARRISGWTMVLAGLSAAALWVTQPVDAAASLTMWVIGGAVLLVALICTLSRPAS